MKVFSRYKLRFFIYSDLRVTVLSNYKYSNSIGTHLKFTSQQECTLEVIYKRIRLELRMEFEITYSMYFLRFEQSPPPRFFLSRLLLTWINPLLRLRPGFRRSR